MSAIELAEVDVVSSVSKQISDELDYPCVLIKGIQSQEELSFFMNRGGSKEKLLPLFLDFEGYIKRIGFFEVSLNTLLVLKSIGDYELFIIKSPSEKVQIDLNSDQVLEKFISL